MNIVDSSGWLEYFGNGPNVSFFAPIIEQTSKLIIPVISIYEVFKKVLMQYNEDKALEAVTLMQQGVVCDLNVALSIRAAKLSQELKIPMADSLILAVAHSYQAVLWTQDVDFKNITGVKYIRKKN